MMAHSVLGLLGLALTTAALVILGLRVLPGPRARSLATPHPRRVLAIGAHPDDLELACGGTLAKLSDSGHEVHALVLSHGERGGEGAARPREARAGGVLLGLTSVQVHDFLDTRLGEDPVGLVQAIEAMIRRVNPDIVLTHSGHDQHQDHQAVHEATLRAARQSTSILCYESPSATPDFRPSVFVDIDEYVEVKVAAVAAHRDQGRKPYMTPERVRGIATFRGSQAKVASAEGYEPVRLLGSALGEL
ncbi:MAG: PIG-L deacetylase family protein [Oryzihumus sp.]